MAGKFDVINDNDYVSSTLWTSRAPGGYDGSNISVDGSGQHGTEIDPMTTNTIAAVVSALLATTFLLLLVFIIRAIRKRRQERQGNRFGVPVVHTITPASFGANVAAYRNVPIAGHMSWESVETSDAPVINSEAV